MNQERLFLDTVCIQANFNSRDQYNQVAKEFLPRVRKAKEI